MDNHREGDSVKVSQIASALTASLAAQLTINVVLGLPEIGRPDVTLPIGALQFRESQYGEANARTLGNPAPKGTTERFALYVIAKHESQLLGLVDALKLVKAHMSSLAIGDEVLTLRWQATRRSELFAGDAPLDFVIEVEVTTTIYS